MASSPHPRLAVMGAGFLGRAVADEARSGGWVVLPVVRSEASAAKLRKEYPEAKAGDAVRPEFWTKDVPECEAMVWCIAPSRNYEDGDFETIHRQGAVQAAAWAGKRRIPFVYISSTSVYAEEKGEWVDEDSPLANDPRSMAMVQAEQACLKAGGTVLRCAGLYGRERVLSTEADGPERWLNLVHVEDAARAVGVALRNPGKIFNVCEDEPRRRGQSGGEWSEGGRRSRRNKRVRNGKLRKLGWEVIAGIKEQNSVPAGGGADRR
ncbi:MAG: NAD-dependent epimerase/dehydratase family protein [Verrucomicrobia bacterium]|nr:NAD-dependent epimerase/dehydratase family protein [Verrucomicrobiota bacterium]